MAAVIAVEALVLRFRELGLSQLELVEMSAPLQPCEHRKRRQSRDHTNDEIPKPIGRVHDVGPPRRVCVAENRREREALGDVASNPRFVQTVARRGYRFIAPVQENTKSSAVPAENTPVTETRAIAENPRSAQVLHPDLEVPIPRRGLTRGLFLLIQLMYLIFYLEGLFHWQGVYQIGASFLPGWAATAVMIAVLITAGIGIPLRCYLISAVAFDHRRFGENFGRLREGNRERLGCDTGPIPFAP